MPLFRIERGVGAKSAAELKETASFAVSCAARFPGVKWHRSYYDATRGQMTCFYEAPDADAIRRHAELAKIPCDAVSEVFELVP